MFKKLLTTAAGLLLTGQVALAQQAGPFGPTQTQGTYAPAPAPQQQGLMFRGQSKGQVVTIELFGQEQTVGGVITFGNQTFPFAGRINGNTIIGNFEVSGNRYGFQASVQGGEMVFVSDGNEIRLSRVNNGGPANDPQPAYVPQQPAYVPQQPAYVPQQPAYVPQQPAYVPQQPAYVPQQPAYVPQQPAYVPQQPRQEAAPTIQPVSGRTWQYLLPTGWQADESDVSVMVSSPDGMLGYGSAIHANTPANSPEDMVRNFISNLKATNVNVLSQRPGTTRNGDATLEVEFTYTSERGMSRHVWLGVGLMRGQNQNVGMLMYAGAPTPLWESQGKTLVSLATRAVLRQAAPTQNRSGQVAGIGY